MSSSRNKYTVVILVAIFGVGVVTGSMGDGGSKCDDATCTPGIPGSECEPKYGEQGDGCCPTWHCSNGQTAYGMSKGGSGSFSSFSSSSTGGGGMQSMQMGNMFGGGGAGNMFGGGGFGSGGFGGGSPFGGGGGGRPFGGGGAGSPFGGGFGGSPFGGSPFGNMFKNMFGRRRRR